MRTNTVSFGLSSIIVAQSAEVFTYMQSGPWSGAPIMEKIGIRESYHLGIREKIAKDLSGISS